MIGLTNYITENPWENTFTIWYTLMDDAYKQLIACLGRRLRSRGPEPRFSDSEVITVSLIIETYFGGNEELGLAFIRQYHRNLFPELLDNGQFNRRRRALTGVMEVIRRQISQVLIDPKDRDRIIDSAPIPACTYARSKQCATISGPEYASVMVSKKAKLFGFRFYATTTLNQILDRWLLAPAAPHDGSVTPAFFEDQFDLAVLGDNAFNMPGEIDWLKRYRNITVFAALRNDAKEPLPDDIRTLFNRLRRRIETAFSVMTTVFNLETPGSRSLGGLLCRLTTTCLAYNLSFLTNVEIFALKTRN
jgi:hypothetical protein